MEIFSFANVFGVLVVSFVAYIIFNIIYSLTLHPLADVPGPKLCAISRIPYWLQCLKGTDVYWMHKLHTRYGPELRFGPTDISYATAQAWKDIHRGPERGKGEAEKAQEFSVQPVNGVPSMLTTGHQNHARVRRVFSPAFSESALRKQEPLLRKYVDILLAKLGELGGDSKPVEMTRIFNFASFDIMAELCFGHPLGLLEKNEFSPWVRSIFDSLKMLPMVSLISYYPLLNAVFTRLEPKWVTEQRVTHCQHAADRVNKRLQEGSDKSDIWNLVISAKDTDTELSLEEMHSNAELFMLAGSETTATLLSGVTYYLLINPDKMNLLCKEIRCSFRGINEITFDSIAGLKYINACIKEGLRIYPPVPIGSPRVVPMGGQAILGRWIPPETRVSVHHYSTYHSEANFKYPETFAPERWFKDPLYKDDILDSHQPFAWGPRNCLGQSMAMHEMRLFLATLLYTFDLELCEESHVWAEQQAYALWMKNPLLCHVRPVTAP